MSELQNSESGFSVTEGLLVVLVLAIIGFGGYYVHHSQKNTNTMSVSGSVSNSSKDKTTTTQPKTTYTTAQLTAIAKQVYFEESGTNGAQTYTSISTCEDSTGGYSKCPFTADLTSRINAFGSHQDFGSPLTGGAQNGPFGTLSYSATPSPTGGTGEVVLTPDDSAGENPITWNLTITETNGQLLVNDITISESAAQGGIPACGPVEIYNDLSC